MNKSCENTAQQIVARCLAVSWAVTLPIYENARLGREVNFAPGKILSRGKSPKNVHIVICTFFVRCKVHFTSKSCALVYLAALLHGTPAADVSQSLRRGTRNGITELLQRAPAIFGRAAITLGIGPHASFSLLWPPCVSDADIIFSSCGFFFYLSSSS